jgi:hypothetical protein
MAHRPAPGDPDRMLFRRVISVVMLSWKRPDNVARIVTALRRSPLVDDILVWNNNPDEPLAALAPDADLAVVRSSRDLGMNTRWAGAALARHEAVLMQDDDVVLSEAALRALHDAWWHDPDVLHGLWGRNPNRDGEYDYEDAEGDAEIALTRALLFHRRHAAAALELRDRLAPEIARLAERDGEDVVFSYGVFTRTGRRQRIHAGLRSQVRPLPQPHAIGDTPGHRELRTRVMRACREAVGLAAPLRSAARG